MNSNFVKGMLVAFIIGIIANTVLYEQFDIRLSKLEKQNKGQVEAWLEPLPKNISNSVYTGPKLYNNHTKIVLNDNSEFVCLARNIFFEGSDQPYIGKIAIAQTVFNRAESGKWGHSFCDVIHASKQFSWTMKKNLKEPKGPTWLSSQHAAKMFMNGVRVKNLEMVDHYHANYSSPYWKDSMDKKATIGGHIFYSSR